MRRELSEAPILQGIVISLQGQRTLPYLTPANTQAMCLALTHPSGFEWSRMEPTNITNIKGLIQARGWTGAARWLGPYPSERPR